jgi:PAS domain S-box-containing protein
MVASKSWRKVKSLHEEKWGAWQPEDELRRLRHRLAQLEKEKQKRDRVERALRTSEAYFRALVENSQDVITILDREGAFTYNNPAFGRLLGYDEEELLGRNALEYLHPEDLPVMVEKFAFVIENPGVEVTAEFRFRHKDGSWRYFEGTGKGIAEDGQFDRIIIDSREITWRKSMEEELRRHREHLEELVEERTRELGDINAKLQEEIEERRRIEAELQRSEEYYRALFENAQDMVMVLEPDGSLRFASPSVERLMGYKLQELKGRGIFDVIHPEDLPRVNEGLQDPSSHPSLVIRVRHKDGSWRYHEAIAKDLRDHPSVRGLVIVARDITDRRRADEYLQRREEYYRALIENAYDVVSVLGRDGVIHFVSPSTKDITGYEPVELVGKNAYEFIHPDDLPKVLEAVNEGVDEPGHVGHMNFRWKHKDGTWHVYEAVGVNLLHNPAVAGGVIHSHDITESVRIQEELEVREEYFRRLLEVASDMVAVLNEDLSIRFVGPSVEEVLGYKVEELLGRNVLDYFHPDDIQGTLIALEEGARNPGAPQPVKARVRHKDGSWRILEALGRNLLEDPVVKGLVVNAHDVTERERVDEELRNKEERFRAMLESASDLTMIINEDLTIRYMSPSVRKVLGYGPEEYLGRPASDFFHPDDAATIAAALEEGLKKPGTPLSLEVHVRHRDGTWRTFESVGRNLADDPLVGGYVVNSHDVTERKAMEESLRESEERYRSLVENINDVVLVLGREGRIEYVSPAISRQSGYTPEELTGRSFAEFVHPEDLQKILERWERLQLGEDLQGSDYRLLDKDGSVRHVHIATRTIVKDGEIAGHNVIMSDITDRKLAEEALRESEEKFRLISEQSMMGIIIIQDGLIKYANQAMGQITGYTAEETRSWRPWEIMETIHPDDRAFVTEQVRKKEGGEPDQKTHYTYRIITKSGEIKHVEIYSRTVQYRGRDADLATVVDITDRVRIEQEIKEREEYYRSLIENALDVIAVVDRDLNVLFVSPSVEKVFGYAPEELEEILGKASIHPDDLPMIAEELARILEDKDYITSMQLRVRHRDGSWRYLEASGRNFLDHPSVGGIVVNFRDITDRKLAEEALRESEEKFRIISEQSLMGVFIIQDDRIKYANRTMEEIHGYSSEEVMSWPEGEYMKIVHPDDRAFVAEQARKKQHGEEGQETHYTYRLVTKAGEVKHVEIYSTTVLYEGRSADLATVVDITDRVHMEHELKEREEYYRSLIENTLDVIAVTDKDLAIQYISPSVEKVLGYGPEEMQDVVGLDYLGPEDAKKVMENLVRILEDPEYVARLELRARHKDGSWRDLEVAARNFLDHPSVGGIVVNFRDITERKMARERLERINRLFLNLGTDLILNMEKIIETCRDVLGGSMGVYARMEKGTLSILNTASGEESLIVTEQPEGYLCYGVILSLGDEPYIVHDLAGSPWNESDPLVKKYGFRSFVGYPVWKGEEKMGCLCVFDARVREFPHEQLELLGTLARALSVEEERLAHEQSLKDFIDVASHELRHPITLMKGYALTLRDYGDRLPEEARREYLSIIGQGADRLDMLIRELLDVSRIERGRFSMNRREVRLEPLIERAVGEMRGKGTSNRIAVSIPRELPPRYLDPEKLVRVLVVLLDNAAVHNPEGCEVAIEAEEKEGQVVVSVLDRGVGVSEKDRERIFERFYQVEDALHHSAPGMGLGLYIAREIIEAHGGRIWHEPREGGGSIFRFTLP